MRRVSVALAVALCLAASLPLVAVAAEGRTLSLSASKFGFTAGAGQTGTGEVNVINEGTEPISVRVYAANQIISEEGIASYVAPPVDANRITSPASWVTLTLPPEAKAVGNVPYIDLAAGERAPVSFKVTVPEGATPGDHNIVLLFEMFSPEDEDQAATTSINARLGARIKARVEGEIVEKLDVRPFTLPAYVIGSAADYSFSVLNEGNVDQSVDARLVVLDRSEAEALSSVLLTDSPVYAATSVVKKGTLELPKPAIGPTHVRLIIDYAGESGVAKSIEKERTVWAIPMWLLIAVGVVLVLFVGAVVWAAASRSARRKMRRSAESAT